MMLHVILALGLAAKAGDPPVRVWLNQDDYQRGDRAKVYARALQDGYLVVLRADADGRVRVLYPLDPGDDNFVRGDNDLEIRGRGDREAFPVDESSGSGTVMAAISHDPFKFDMYVRGDHWDYRVLGEQRASDDREAGLLDVVRQMAGTAHFDYDVATYTVESPSRYRTYSTSTYDSYYDPFGYTCFGCGPYYRPYGFGVGFRFGYGNGYCDSFYYDPFCDPLYYGYSSFYPRGYYPGSYYYPSGGFYYSGRYGYGDPQAASRRWSTIHRRAGPPLVLAGRHTPAGTYPTSGPAAPRSRQPVAPPAARPSQPRGDGHHSQPGPIWQRPRPPSGGEGRGGRGGGDRISSPPPVRQPEARSQPEHRASPGPSWSRPRSSGGGGGGRRH